MALRFDDLRVNVYPNLCDNQCSNSADSGIDPIEEHKKQAKITAEKINDDINHPSHYTSHPSGIECIQVTEHLNFCLGNAMKYIWRAGLKESAEKDIKKAIWYLQRELKRIGEVPNDAQ